ncbi:MAG: peptidylprolyl isomerase [Cyanobacteria bacterium TGS_CYA1]|nr:peptidylprolyl isomerase [Cyanobacteria bacterium TGS_CYA1]
MNVHAFLSRFKIKAAQLVPAAICANLLLAPYAQAQSADDPVVELVTTKGKIYIQVFYNLVPRTGANFLDLVDRGAYDGTIFHRIEKWCIQGGDPTGSGRGNFVDPETGNARFIPLEINRALRHNRPGVVAMARSNHPDSASCQFYITKQAINQLDNRYAIFGRVLGNLGPVMNMQRGDQIVSARIVQAPGGRRRSQDNSSNSGDSSSSNSNSGSSSSGSNSSSSSQGTPQAGGRGSGYQPIREIPDSGF